MNRGPFVCALMAYLLWGFMPLYFAFLKGISPGEILAHRVAWSGILLAVLSGFTGRWPEVIRWLKSPRLALAAFGSTLLIAANWLLYILATTRGEVLQASLGYYITPLFSVLLGLVVFGEKLRVAQWVALGFAAAGVLVQGILFGKMPWLGLGLMFSFGLYGFARKKMGIDSIAGLTLETTLICPVAIGFLLFWHWEGTGIFLGGNSKQDLWLVLAAPVTAAPLLFFGVGARGLPLSLMGFLQYLSPTVQMLVATVFLGETLTTGGLASFALIWIGLLVFVIEAWHTTTKVQAKTSEELAKTSEELAKTSE